MGNKKDTFVIGHNGLANKYIFELEGGFVAMAKPLERNVPFYSFDTFPTRSVADGPPSNPIRLDREYQGWGEIVGYYLDKILGFNRKPIIGEPFSFSFSFSILCWFVFVDLKKKKKSWEVDQQQGPVQARLLLLWQENVQSQ